MCEGLKKILNFNEKRILFVGVGNLLKSDDGAGVYICKNIIASGNISALSVEVSIENYIGKINSLKPDIMVVIDCIDMKAAPGTSKILGINDLQDNTFTTHNISFGRLNEFFEMPVMILGIQPEKVAFGEKLSYLVKNEADRIINLINSKEV